jgi:mRNA interferase RelE/StbE
MNEMKKYKLSSEAIDFLSSIPKKHTKQILEKITKLADDLNSVPYIKVKGLKNINRAKSGEYRIIFRIENQIVNILVLKIGKRNDGEVYQNLDNLKK